MAGGRMQFSMPSLKLTIAVSFSMVVSSILAVSDKSELPKLGTLGEQLDSQLSSMHVSFGDGDQIQARRLSDGTYSLAYLVDGKTPRYLISIDDEYNELVLSDARDHTQAVFHTKMRKGWLFHAAMTLRLLDQTNCDAPSLSHELYTRNCTAPALSELAWHGPVLASDDMIFEGEAKTKIAPRQRVHDVFVGRLHARRRLA